MTLINVHRVNWALEINQCYLKNLAAELAVIQLKRGNLYHFKVTDKPPN